MTRAAPRLAGGLLLLTVAALAASAGFSVAAGDVMDAFAFVPVLLAFASVGAIVVSHRPANPIGWLFLGEGLAFAISLATDSYARYATNSGTTPPAAAWAAWLGAILGELGFMFPLALLAFPDGHLPSPRWRVIAWLIAAAEGLLIVAAASSGAALKAQGSSVLRSPVRLIPGSLADPAVNVVQTALIPLAVAAAAGCVARYRRSSADARRQIKWFAYAGAITAIALLISEIAFSNPLDAFLAFGPLIPVAAGIAIMKFRLYDIDVIISKTIVYGSLAAFITAVYVAIVAGIGSLGSRSLAAGSRPDLALSILATAVVAVAFQPVRERMQHLANRLVYGQRATPYEALSEFARQVGGTYAVEDLLPQLARILAEGTGAERADVWLKGERELRVEASWPPDAGRSWRVAFENDEAPAIDGADRLILVRHEDEVLGALSVSKRAGESLTPAEDKLVSDLGAQAGLILRNAGLTEQLLVRLTELRASRLRIVAAQDDQRRRIERDIHDGAQQQLLAIAGTLELAESMAGRAEDRERALITQLKEDTRGALETLRELARGIYPPLLADQGLTAAVGAQVRKAPMAVELETDGIGRYPEDIETAIYFCCVEALLNAGKHANPSIVRIRLSDSGGEVSFAVEDDGPGFDQDSTRASSGLLHMGDRLAALGGSLEIGSSPGSGMTVAGRIPTSG